MKPKRLVFTILACVFVAFLMLLNVSIAYASLARNNLAIDAVVLQNNQGGNNNQGCNQQGNSNTNNCAHSVPEPSVTLMLAAVGVLTLGGAAYRRLRK